MIISPYQNNPERFLNKFSMIMATSINGKIGNNNKLLWNLPNDLKRFKKITYNRIVVMGENTFKSLPNGPLPNRLNIVMSQDVNFLKEETEFSKKETGLVKLSSISEVFNFIHNFELNPAMSNIKCDEFFIIGGSMIYNLFLPYINKLYLTIVEGEFEGNVNCPDLNQFDWNELEEIENFKDDKHDFNYIFYTLKK